MSSNAPGPPPRAGSGPLQPGGGSGPAAAAAAHKGFKPVVHWLDIDRRTQEANIDGIQKQKSVEGRRQMKERYKFIMKEVDLSAAGDGFIGAKQELPTGNPAAFQFMDVCCCPGGFSEYTLMAAPNCRGLGLSLPTELGGHIPSLDTKDHMTGQKVACPLADTSRYHIHFQDVTTIASSMCMGPLFGPQGKPPASSFITDKPATSLGPSHQFRNQCDMMILDGSFLGGKKNIYMEVNFKSDKDNPAFNVYGNPVAANQALLCAQLAIMAWNLKAGGNLVLRMSMTWSEFSNGVLALLRLVFKGTIMNYKPRSCHTEAISYYLVCKDFDLQKAEQIKFGTLWAEATAHLRRGADAFQFVPFQKVVPELCSVQALYARWGFSLMVYYLPLWIFRKLCDLILANPALQMVLDRPYPARLCWKHMVFRGTSYACRSLDGECQEGAHSNWTLHPFVYVAFSMVDAHLHLPQPNGDLPPGCQHPRNERSHILKVVNLWHQHMFKNTVGGAARAEEILNGAELLSHALVNDKLWPQILQICNMEEAAQFRSITKGGLAAVQATFTQLRALRARMAGSHQSIAERILSGEILTMSAVPTGHTAQMRMEAALRQRMLMQQQEQQQQMMMMAQMAGMAGAPGMMDPMMMAAAGMGGSMGHGAQVFARLKGTWGQGMGPGMAPGMGGEGPFDPQAMMAFQQQQQQQHMMMMMHQQQQSQGMHGPTGSSHPAGGAAGPGARRQQLKEAKAAREAVGGDTLAAYPESDDDEEVDEEILKLYATTPISGYGISMGEVLIADDFSQQALIDFLGG